MASVRVALFTSLTGKLLLKIGGLFAVRKEGVGLFYSLSEGCLLKIRGIFAVRKRREGVCSQSGTSTSPSGALLRKVGEGAGRSLFKWRAIKAFR